ncbi:hypothetical protein HDN1F_07350 [gamma proteobacterium HdN1]|nr:hypothetical protein HDN1F_07350 [gamma proteobacterium HdN1]
MSTPKTALEHWQSLRPTLQEKLDACDSVIDAAVANAVETFEDRLKKISDPLAAIVRQCLESVELNARLAKSQRTFLVNQLQIVDAAVAKANAQFEKTRARSDSTEPFAGSELAIVGPLMASTSKMVLDVLCLSWLLCTFLGHKEANAFANGAMREFIGALGDPGAGILTLLQRLYAVATRTLRKDQDAAELLQSLGDFSELMEKWRQVAGHMGDDMEFAAALKKAVG